MAKENGTWIGKALIALRKRGESSAVDMAALTKDIEFGGMEKTIEQIVLNNGGFLVKENPVSNIEITFPRVFLVGSEAVLGYFMGSYSSEDDVTTIQLTNDTADVRLAVLWTEDSSVSSAEDAVPAGSKALRIVVKHCNIDYLRPKTEDRNMEWEMKLSAPPMDRNGDSNLEIKHAGASSTSGLPALGSYD